MACLRCFALASLACVHVAAEVLKLGAVIQETGAGADAIAALGLWKDWANQNSADIGYTVEATLLPYSADDFRSRLQYLTDPASPGAVHAVMCPYTSSASMTCVDHVNESFTGPIIVWGGASDSIFNSHCVGKNCFGFLTTASEYMSSGIEAIDYKTPSIAQVAVLVYQDAFSASVAAGVNATILARSGMALQSYTSFSGSEALTGTDLRHLRQAAARKPDLVIIIGHNTTGAIIEFGKGRYTPKAILATNSINHIPADASHHGSDWAFLQGTLMPTQWAENAFAKDEVVGWTTAAFKAALGASATYQGAAAGAVGVALANAMASSTASLQRVANLSKLMRALDFESFYGKIKFRADGTIEKHMYTQQLQNMTSRIVAPSLASTAPLQFPLTGYWPATIKIGGVLQSSAPGSYGAAAIDLWVQWVNDNRPGYSVDATGLRTYDSNRTDGGIPGFVQALTSSSNEELVDVLICPYTTAASKLCIDSVAAGFVGPIIVWGAAADSIFSENCVGKNCLGFLALASSYMELGMAAAAAKHASAAAAPPMKVAVIVNSNAFSSSVAAGVNATIASGPAVTLQSYTTLSVQKAALSKSDLVLIDEAMSLQPELAIVIGHNQDVEPAITRIGQHPHHPEALIATNSITSIAKANFGFNAQYMECVVMPTQWAERPDVMDPVVGWTTQAFKAALGSKATYHAAAAGAVGVAIANAMSGSGNANERRMALAANMKSLNVSSFYGQIRFDAAGVIAKPMYAQQKQLNGAVIVDPANPAALLFPLSSPKCWGLATTAGPMTTTTVAISRTTGVIATTPLRNTNSTLNSTKAAPVLKATGVSTTISAMEASETRITSSAPVSTTTIFQQTNGMATTTRIGASSTQIEMEPFTPSIPLMLTVIAPNGPANCAGVYMFSGQMANELPLWKHLSEDRWVYSLKSGRWGVGGKVEADMDFQSDGAYMFCDAQSSYAEVFGALKELGRTLCSKPWQRWTGESWTEDATIEMSFGQESVGQQPQLPTLTQAPDGQQEAIVSSRLAEAVKKGDKTLNVQNPEGFLVGQLITIDKGNFNEEVNMIVGFGSLMLEWPMRFAHIDGVQITSMPTPSQSVLETVARMRATLAFGDAIMEEMGGVPGMPGTPKAPTGSQPVGVVSSEASPRLLPAASAMLLSAVLYCAGL